MEPFTTPLNVHTPNPHLWPEEHDNLLRQRAAEGWSALELANLIGRSRSAVLGRAHRLGVKFHHSRGGNPRRKRTARISYGHLT